ncbi:glycosyl transferase family 90 [Methylobacterium fujisawaense]|uniref:glycosyl transferase family 90 n=1 Tax=Methylobacterium fujisawaense TaxID=107400 RepID=UPI002F360CB4
MLTRDEVIDSFKLVLKRDPENDFTIEHFRNYEHVGPLLMDLVSSAEYDDVRRRRKAPNLTEYAFIDKGFEKAGIIANDISYRDHPLFTMILSNEHRVVDHLDSPVRLDITLSEQLKDQGENLAYKKLGQRRLGFLMQYLGPYISEFAQSNKFRLAFDFGDHGTPGFISMDRPSGADWPLMPDVYLFQASREYIARLDLADFLSDFKNRIPKLFWRGSTTGSSITSEHDLFRNYRVACCQTIANNAGASADCKISRIAQVGEEFKDRYISALSARGLFGDPVQEEVFTKYMMYVDMPGNTAGWGTCFKYLRGCLIFRPSQSRELAYSSLLRPWEHYIPLETDMSDAGERVAWVLENLDAAATIAWRGHCLLHDFLSNMKQHLTEVFVAQNQLN